VEGVHAIHSVVVVVGGGGGGVVVVVGGGGGGVVVVAVDEGGGGGGGGQAAAPSATPAAEAPAAAPAAGPTIADIKLLGFPEGAKFPVLKEIRKLKPGMNLVDSKKLVEELPQIVGKRISGDELEEWKKALDTLGCQYELIP